MDVNFRNTSSDGFPEELSMAEPTAYIFECALVNELRIASTNNPP